ncbi:hypothetical protein D918_09848 [Trichuris suis]|nr:hypothetical protein D918_09848 [Trichuris suis]
MLHMHDAVSASVPHLTEDPPILPAQPSTRPHGTAALSPRGAFPAVPSTPQYPGHKGQGTASAQIVSGIDTVPFIQPELRYKCAYTRFLHG